MSVFKHLAPLTTKVSASSEQAKEHPSLCLSPPLSLSSPVIRKKPIQIPSFDGKGLVFEKHIAKPIQSERSFVPICSLKTSSPSSWSRSCHYSQRNYTERASTLPRAKPKIVHPPTLSAKPCIPISHASKPNSSPTLKPKPRDSLHPHDSQLCDSSPFLHQPPPKPSVSPTLTVPTPRLSPSPTSLCAGRSSDSRGGKQPSPVAQERRARSIPISNPKVELESSKQRSLKEAKHDVLDQAALLEFTHPVLRRASSMTGRDSHRPTGTSQNSCLLQGNVCLNKKEQNAKDKLKLSYRTKDITTNLTPKSDIKQQELLQTGATGPQTSLSEYKVADVVQRESQSVFEGWDSPAGHNSHRKPTDFPLIRTARFTSNEQSSERRFSERQVTPQMSFSTEPLLNQTAVSPNVEIRRRHFGRQNETKVDTAFLSISSQRRPQEENTTQRTKGNSRNLSPQTVTQKSPQKLRFWSSQSTQIDVPSKETQSACESKDYQSKAIDQKMEAPQVAHRLNRFKTCTVAPQSQEASRAASECNTSKHVLSQKHQFDHKQFESHRGMSFSDTGLNQTDIFAPSYHHRVPENLPECPSETRDVSQPPSVAQCPLNTNSFGISSEGMFDYKQCQRPNEKKATTASLPLQRPNNHPAGRAFIMEEEEDPYYVTMYYPGSVYVGEYRDIPTT